MWLQAFVKAKLTLMNDEDMQLYRLDAGVAAAVTKKGDELTKLRNDFSSSMAQETSGGGSSTSLDDIHIHSGGGGTDSTNTDTGQKPRKYSPIQRKADPSAGAGSTPPRTGATVSDRAFSPSLEDDLWVMESDRPTGGEHRCAHTPTGVY
jgi:hypothetical protein